MTVLCGSSLVTTENADDGDKKDCYSNSFPSGRSLYTPHCAPLVRFALLVGWFYADSILTVSHSPVACSRFDELSTNDFVSLVDPWAVVHHKPVEERTLSDNPQQESYYPYHPIAVIED